MKEINNNKLQVASCTLAQLLNIATTEIPGTNIRGQLTIPEYQRPYVWTEKQINQLLNDWMSYAEIKNEKPLFYLGSIILHYNEDNLCLNIIDGQQRITTALMLQRFKSEQIISGITYSSPVSIEKIHYNLSYLKAVKEKDIFEYSHLDIIETIDFNDINVTLVITYNEDLAYTFFETQNTGGVRLSGSDILKAHHLRAIPNSKIVNYQARKWESIESRNVEYIIQQLTKIRSWDNRHWKRFPFYRDSNGIKQSITDEFTLFTNSNGEDVSYHYSAVKNDDGRYMQMNESQYKMLKQPLSDGNNTLDYINDYIELYHLLFREQQHYLIDDRFYDFRNKLLHGSDGTIFLKELFEVAILSYVSRFGFYRLLEASLWLYRAIYSLRVSYSRNVKEASVFNFVYVKQFIDNILEVFTPDELFLYLKKLRYIFDTTYLVEESDNNKDRKNTAKTRYIESLHNYFKGMGSVKHYYKNANDFDKDLKEAINKKLKQDVTAN
jgi:hypothetical protein